MIHRGLREYAHLSAGSALCETQYILRSGCHFVWLPKNTKQIFVFLNLTSFSFAFNECYNLIKQSHSLLKTKRNQGLNVNCISFVKLFIPTIRRLKRRFLKSKLYAIAAMLQLLQWDSVFSHPLRRAV